MRLPTWAQVTSTTLAPWHPGQVVHASPYTGSVSVLHRSSGSWQGAIDIGPLGASTAANLGGEMESLLASLRGAAGTLEVPIHRRTIPRSLVVTATTVTDEIITTYFESGSDFSGLAAGMWARAGERCFVLHAVDAAARTLEIYPAARLDLGDMLSPTTTMLVRLRPGQYPSIRTPDFFGGWRLAFEEAYPGGDTSILIPLSDNALVWRDEQVSWEQQGVTWR